MRELKEYYQSIYKSLPCSGKQKKRFLQDLKQSVGTYLSENPNVDFSSIVSHFGTPQQITDTYIGEISTPELLQKLRLKKRIIRIVVTVATSIVLLWGTVVTIALINEFNDADGCIIVEAPIIED